tara:strand:- start:4082 stop:5254 length:1173 start_codon:yes stop_codon:yes gene_type:complete
MNSWPKFSKAEAEKAKQILLSGKVNYWTGNEGKAFEQEFSKFTGTKYSIAVSNGSVALDLALRSLKIKKGDEVIVTPRSFIASASCVSNIGANPIFADVDPISGNLTSSTISKKITKKTKAVICVHLGGFPCEMDEIMKLAKRNNISVIEDCSQAHGAYYKGKSVGSIGDIGTWSFCQDKIITTGGEGGMVTTNNKKLWQIMWSYKDHGKNHHSVFKKSHRPGFRWLHDSFGTNFRMTEIQASIGRSQLRKLKAWNRLRNRNARIIHKVAKKFPSILDVPDVSVENIHAFYRVYINVKKEGLKEGWNRDKLIEEMNKNGVQAFSGSCSEIYLEKSFKNSPFFPKKRLSNAKKIGETSICFLAHPTLTISEMNLTSRKLFEIFSKAKKNNL